MNEEVLKIMKQTGTDMRARPDLAPPTTGPTEPSFASVVIYVDDIAAAHPDVAIKAANELAAVFKTYEVVVVDDGCDREVADVVVSALAGHPLSIVRMGNRQGLEAAMNAGVDASIGDYVFEVDDLGAFDVSFVRAAYAEAMAGADIVNGVFAGGSSPRGRIFYNAFNRFSGYPTKLASNPCHLLSRRAINRVRSMSGYAPYRKASYAASGLRVVEVSGGGRATRKTDLAMAVTSLALYTDVFYKVAFWLAAVMAVLSLAEIAYVAAVAVSGVAVTGWVTTMLVLTVGFMAVFVLFAFSLKYLDLLVKITFERQGYLTNGIERPDFGGNPATTGDDRG